MAAVHHRHPFSHMFGQLWVVLVELPLPELVLPELVLPELVLPELVELGDDDAVVADVAAWPTTRPPVSPPAVTPTATIAIARPRRKWRGPLRAVDTSGGGGVSILSFMSVSPFGRLVLAGQILVG